MDTKSRSFRKKLVAGGSVVFVAAAGIAFVTGCMLALCYSLDYWETRIPTVQDNISILWMVEMAVFFIALLALIIALWKTGEKDENGKIKLNWFDRLFTDLQIVAGGLAVFGIGLMSYIYFDILKRYNYRPIYREESPESRNSPWVSKVQDSSAQ